MADKLLPAPALNVPPKQPRAADPNRFRSIDMQPENAQNDPEYLKMVQDIEALQQRQGWLAGRGAFDKDDYLYLQDKEQQQRATEVEQRDEEAAAYAAARARIEQQQQLETARASLKQLHPAKHPPSKPLGKTPAPLQAVVKVKQHSREQQKKQADVAQPLPHHLDVSEPAGKKPRLESSSSSSSLATEAAAHGVPGGGTVQGSAAGQGQLYQQPDAVAGQCHDGAGSTAANAQHQAVEVPQAGSAHGPSGDNAERPTAHQLQNKVPAGEEDKAPADAAAGLGGLLGYGSESEDEPDGDSRSEEQQQQQQQARQANGSAGGALQLPSAADLLGQELDSSSFAKAHEKISKAFQDSSPQGGWHGQTAKGPAYQQQQGWI